MTNEENARLLPTGTCWCGCGAITNIGSFFARGHDKVAEAALLAARYDSSVARLLDHHGFGPGSSVLEAAVKNGGWEECPHCEYKGAPLSIRNHIRRYHEKK
ncbi:hypothetical protein [Streptomyces griseofuscus]|uniref:hypothetical protein n=1 Tax=Streptomyces griseofuscus TaxID=146922 RepID=UPI0033C28428